jgi:flavodoxin
MSKAVVVYKSNYGSTKTYSQAIAQKLNADLFSASEADAEKTFGV